ncbi:MAG: ABC transporter ATP-binding protein [Dethiobacteria bacterium]|jgi:iron complex transport system ATP-binding protein
MALIELKNLSFGYSEQDLFTGLELQINAGEVFCLLGPNGCGKTTLLDCILGLLRPRQGEILLNGKNIKHLNRETVARQIAYVPQVHEKTFPYKVLDIVLMGRAAYTKMFSSPTREDLAVAEEALEMVSIGRLKERRYTQLSGGEGQLVMVARALAQKTPLIIMDEPTAHLDFKHELTIMETIVKLVHETNLAVLMSTHFPNHTFYFESNKLKTRLALMNQGKFLATGKPSEVLTEKNLKLLYHINAEVVSYNLQDKKELKQVIPVSTLPGV